MTHGLDQNFHNTTRLQIAAFLSGCNEAEFRAVQEYCDLSKSTLSKNVSVLEDAGYVSVRKGYVGKFPRTWLALTDTGRAALTAHMTALRQIADTAAKRAPTG